MPHKHELSDFLMSRAVTLLGSHMIHTLVESAYEWCQQRDINMGPSICPMPWWRTLLWIMVSWMRTCICRKDNTCRPILYIFMEQTVLKTLYDGNDNTQHMHGVINDVTSTLHIYVMEYTCSNCGNHNPQLATTNLSNKRAFDLLDRLIISRY